MAGAEQQPGNGAARHFDPERVRLVVITDGRGDLARLEAIVRAALVGGATCVQLREPHWSARVLAQACERLLPICEWHRALLLVNDRVDVAAAGLAHGVQVGHRSLPPQRARAVLGPSRVLGFSAHDARELGEAAAAGCDFALLSPVWPTQSKPGAPHLGVARAAAFTAASPLPVVWLGGITVERAAELAGVPPARRPAGLAVRSAVLHAADPERAAAELSRALRAAGGQQAS